MDKKTVLLNLDYMPPAPSQMTLLSAKLRRSGADKVAIRVIDNFPWSFDNRMRSDSSFPEQLFVHFISDMMKGDLNISIQFPGPGDFTRILRLNGFRRMATGEENEILSINYNQLGFKSLIETIVEDVCSLLPGIGELSLPAGTDRNYIREVSGCISDRGCRLGEIPAETDSGFADQMINGTGEGTMFFVLEKLKKTEAELSESIFRLKKYTVMSLSSIMQPAASGITIGDLIRKIREQKAELDCIIENFASLAKSLIDNIWLEIYIRSTKLTLDEELNTTFLRLKQIGLLN